MRRVYVKDISGISIDCTKDVSRIYRRTYDFRYYRCITDASITDSARFNSFFRPGVMVFFQARLQLSSGCKGSSHCRSIRRFWASKAISMGGAVQICWKVSKVSDIPYGWPLQIAGLRAACQSYRRHKLTRGFQIAQASE